MGIVQDLWRPAALRDYSGGERLYPRVKGRVIDRATSGPYQYPAAAELGFLAYFLWRADTYTIDWSVDTTITYTASGGADTYTTIRNWSHSSSTATGYVKVTHSSLGILDEYTNSNTGISAAWTYRSAHHTGDPLDNTAWDADYWEQSDQDLRQIGIFDRYSVTSGGAKTLQVANTRHTSAAPDKWINLIDGTIDKWKITDGIGPDYIFYRPTSVSDRLGIGVAFKMDWAPIGFTESGGTNFWFPALRRDTDFLPGTGFGALGNIAIWLPELSMVGFFSPTSSGSFGGPTGYTYHSRSTFDLVAGSTTVNLPLAWFYNASADFGASYPSDGTPATLSTFTPSFTLTAS